MTWARSCSELIAALRNLRFTRPKQASGENLVWPVIIKCSWMEVYRPVMTHQSRYCTIVLFLFCPLHLSACRLALVSPRPWWLKKSSMLTTCVCTLPCIACLVDNKVHLSWDSLTAYPNYVTIHAKTYHKSAKKYF